ncbi:MAG: sulfatase [Chloroflexota bacterium]
MNKPNVILLTIDTLRADWVGCYGHQPSLTPNLDKLAARGIRFAQAITGGSWTQAAFPVIITSSYASMYGGCLGALAQERPSPLAILGENGYRTAAFSTSPLLSKTYGYHRDFHEFVDLIPQEKDPKIRYMKGGQRLLRTPLFHQMAKMLGIRTRPAKIYDTATDLNTQVRQWIDRADKPFFVWAHYMDVHWPYHLEDTLTAPENIAQAWRDLAHMHASNWNQQLISPEQRRHYIQLYEDALRYTDTEIGKLFDYLEKSGRFEDTVIIVVADHGEEFLDHGRWGHFENNLHDEILRAVVDAGARCTGCTGCHPTGAHTRSGSHYFEFVWLCCSRRCRRESLTPLWTGQPDTYKSNVSVSEMLRDDWHIVAVRTEEFKFIWDSRQSDNPRLYDLQEDPGEANNIAAQYPAIVKRLLAYVEERRRRMDETMPDEATGEPNLDAELLNRLRGLGYVE